MATRLLTAAPTCFSLPRTLRPSSPSAMTEMSFALAVMETKSTAEATTSSIETGTGDSSGSSPWSRDSSMICWISRESRSLSVSIREANR